MARPPPSHLRYPLARTTFGREEIDAAVAVLESDQHTMGRCVAAFERAFASWVGAPHAVMVNSGSSANLVAVEALLRRPRADAELEVGDEVLVPALAWPTTVWPLVQLGLRPIFVDIHPKTLAIDLDAAKAALTPRTRGMFMIHVLGRVPDMGAFTSFCADASLVLLEDTCETLGGHWANRHAGTFGRMGTFSLYYSHHISAIEGGVVVCNDAALADDLRSIRAHGWSRDRSDAASWTAEHPDIDPRFLFVGTGFNVRPMELQAAIGSVQLARLDEMLEQRRRLVAHVADLVERHAPYLELIGAEALTPAVPERSARAHAWMTIPFRVRGGETTRRDAVTRILEAHGVDTRPVLAGNFARHPAVTRFIAHEPHAFPVADDLHARGFMIGCHPRADDATLAVLDDAFAALGQARLS